MSDLPITYKGEAQLVRWAESPSAGRTLTLRLEEEGLVHPFKGLKCGDNGARMQVVIVLVDDQEKPMAPPSGGSKKDARHRKWADMSPSQRAAVKLADPEFQCWLAKTYPEIWDRHYYQEIGGPDASPGAANCTLKEVLGITSKRDLVTYPLKGEKFERLLATFENRNFIR